MVRLERRLLALAAALVLAVVAAAFLIAASYVALADWLESEAAGAAIVGGVLLLGARACLVPAGPKPALPAPGQSAPMDDSIAAPIALALRIIQRKPLAALAVFAAAGFAVAERPKEAMGVVRELARLAARPREPRAPTHA